MADGGNTQMTRTNEDKGMKRMQTPKFWNRIKDKWRRIGAPSYLRHKQDSWVKDLAFVLLVSLFVIIVAQISPMVRKSIFKDICE